MPAATTSAAATPRATRRSRRLPRTPGQRLGPHGLVHVERLPPRPARTASLSRPLPTWLDEIGSSTFFTGDEYIVRLPDGREMNFRSWLLEELAALPPDLQEPPTP